MADLEEFAETHSGWLFRGRRRPNWRLETSLERASRRCGVEKRQYERAIVREFQRHVPAYLTSFPSVTDTLAWLALMQHYGAPTRLLDFTESFWIALFFAFEDAEEACVVLALDRSSLGQKRGRDFSLILRQNIEDELHVDDFLYEDVPFFTNPRLAIQKGTFVFSLNLSRTFHELLIQNRKGFEELTVSATLFPQIRRKLNDFNCNSHVLFPGIDGYARYFKNYTA